MALLTRARAADLEGLLRGYDLGGLASFRALAEGTVNSGFRLETSSNSALFLRIYEEQERPGAEREGRLLAHLAGRGVKTPRPLPSRDGSLVGEVCGKPAALFSWVDGTMRCQAGVRPADAWAIGDALARLHEAGAGFEAIPGRFDEGGLRARLERIAGAPDAELAAQAGPLGHALDRWSRARDPGLPRGLVHGDLFRDNVLWQGNEIVALLDFESACDGTFAYDLMVTLLSWCVGDALDPVLARALVAGYSAVRSLSEAERSGLLAEGCAAAVRFTITRITDRAMRGLTGIKDWRRFRMRLDTLEQLGERGLRELLGV